MRGCIGLGNGTGSNQSVEKALRIIEVMAEAHSTMRLMDIAAAVDMPSSTVLRMLTTLIGAGYAFQDPQTQCYGLTTRFAQLGYMVLSQYNIRDIVHPFLVQLMHEFGETVCLAIDQNMQAIYLDVVENTNNMINIRQRIGRSAPFHATGCGKMMFAQYAPEKRRAYIEKNGLPAYTQYTICDEQRLNEELEKICRQGYSIDDQEIELGVRCVCVPIMNYQHRLIATISISGPLSRMENEEHLHEIIARMKEVAAQVSEKMYYLS